MTKADFDSIYSAPDPRAYCRTLGELDYRIPDYGGRIFAQVSDHLRSSRDSSDIRVADLCCSYGMIGALLKHDIGWTGLVDHYNDPACESLDREAMVERDRDLLADLRRRDAPVVVGVDVSAPAVAYGVDAGLIDAGAAENLEEDDPSPALAEALAPVDLVTVTGGIGYITERTFGKVISATEEATPWVAALSLRWVDFEPIAELGADQGLVTERLDGVTFPQRRFASHDERQFVISQLEERSIDPSGREADGYHHADLYLLRPEDELDVPLADLVPAGGSSPTG